MSFPSIITSIFRFIFVWLVSAFLVTFVWYVSVKIFTWQFQQNWWFEGTYQFSEFFMINLFLFFFLCVLFFIVIKGLLRNFSNKIQIILSSILPVISILIFEIVSGVHLFFLRKGLFFRWFGFSILLLSGVVIFCIDYLICKWLESRSK